MMYQSSRLLIPPKTSIRPFRTNVRVTTTGFFSAFDVPFLYGSPWIRADDDKPGAAIDISRSLNQKLFGGENSVGPRGGPGGHPLPGRGRAGRLDASAALLRLERQWL
jgi:putative ABC transport system permease protein